jgi:hypothetical protein
MSDLDKNKQYLITIAKSLFLTYDIFEMPIFQDNALN